MQRNSTRPVERKAFITSRPRRPLPTKAIPSRSFAPTTREYETAVIAAALTPTNQSLLFIFNPRKARSSLRLQAERRTASPAENLLERLTRGSDGLFPRFFAAQALFFNDRPARPIHYRVDPPGVGLAAQLDATVLRGGSQKRGGRGDR